MSVLEELQRSAERIVEEVGPSVVGLGRVRSVGTGVVLAQDQVLTNAHNLRREEVTVTFADGRRETGRVEAVDVDADLAVVAAPTGDAPPLEWSSAVAGVGTPVFALANPAGSGLRVTFGLVSGTGRSFRGPRGRRTRGGIEHTAPLPRGSSGGPVVDASGRLLGINTLRLEGGLILALAADDELRSRAESLARGEAPSRATLGVHVAPPRAARRLRRAVGLSERDGVLVRRVVEGSAAERAGIERGDLVVTAAGKPVESLDDLYTAVDGAAGSTLELGLVRGEEERTVTVELG